MAVATARVVVLMAPDEKEEIAKRAARDGISVGEFVRRSVWNSITDDVLEAELEARRGELEPLLEELERRNAESLAAIDATLARVDEVLAGIGKREADDELERADLGQFQDRDAGPRQAPGAQRAR
jgi:hypothetical protein